MRGENKVRGQKLYETKRHRAIAQDELAFYYFALTLSILSWKKDLARILLIRRINF